MFVGRRQEKIEEEGRREEERRRVKRNDKETELGRGERTKEKGVQILKEEGREGVLAEGKLEQSGLRE